MAKFLSYYSLCPLIEEKTFLGIAEDSDPNIVIVTAYSNIISRYNVSDPKQVNSWNCKGSLTSTTVYDSSDEKYAAIFNHNEIRKWTITDESIDKVKKKFKFTEKLHGLLVSKETGKILVLFQNGCVLPLNEAIEKRKDTFVSRLKESSEIVFYDVISLSEGLCVVLLIRESLQYRLVGIPVNDTKFVFDIPVENSDEKLVGYCLYFDKQCHFISLWSNGKLYRDNVLSNTTSVPSHCISSVKELNLKKPVAMKTLSSNCMAICGVKDDGLLLMIYDTKFNIIQCEQFYENCPSTPRLWNINSRLFLIMGHNLVVVPFSEEHRNLSTLFRCNSVPLEDVKNSPPETEIYRIQLPKLMEEENIDRILEIVKRGPDISDSSLISLLCWSSKERKSREEVMKLILNEYCVNINDASILRSYCTMEESFALLEYIMTNIGGNSCSFKLLKWASLLIDTFYRDYIMSDDKLILEKLKTFSDFLQTEYSYANEFKELASVAWCVKRGKILWNK